MISRTPPRGSNSPAARAVATRGYLMSRSIRFAAFAATSSAAVLYRLHRHELPKLLRVIARYRLVLARSQPVQVNSLKLIWRNHLLKITPKVSSSKCRASLHNFNLKTSLETINNKRNHKHLHQISISNSRLDHHRCLSRSSSSKISFNLEQCSN